MCSYKSSRIGERIGSKMKSIPSRRAFLAAGTKSLSPEIKMILAVFGGDGRCGSLSGGYQRQHDFKPPEQCAGGKPLMQSVAEKLDAGDLETTILNGYQVSFEQVDASNVRDYEWQRVVRH